MDKKIIIANWKSYKTTSEAESFLEKLSQGISKINLDNKEIMVAPSFQLLEVCARIINKLNITVKICAQNVSPYPEGAYTGEVSAGQIKEFADYSIIGHSERREFFGEDDEILKKKVKEARSEDLEVVYCLQSEEQKIPQAVSVIAYEPPSAIGTGKPDDPLHIEKVFLNLKKKFDGKILYGGSVDESNVREYIYIRNCSGLLVGGASLRADSFIALLSQW